ncbi:MAG: HAMP domain-containing protein [Anaerolineae bacterium]|nr:HAMP domain-containing protein [Anaerolineae bacterium]
MFKSLEAKLIGTYALIVAFSLLVAGGLTVAVLNTVQLNVAERYLSWQATNVARVVQFWLDQGRPLPELRRFLELQRAGNQQIFWLNGEGRVIGHVRPPDEALSLEGEYLDDLPDRPGVVPAPTNSARQRPIIPRLPVSSVHRIDLGTRTLVYAVVAIPRGPLDGAPRPNLPGYVGIAVPINEVAAWPLIARPLGVIGLLVFAVTVLVGVWLARSITTPISQMTRASAAMARGDYAQTIEVQGDDEVARLGKAFNQMAREVDRAHRMQRDFLVNVSHDLKTPLTSIQGFAQAMVDGSLTTPEDYAKAGGIIYAESDRMRRLIGQLLDLARLQGGVAQLARDKVDLLPLLAIAANTARERAQAAGLEFITRLPDALPPVTGDANRLEQVIHNLLDNAVKYTPAGGQVELSAAAGPEVVALSVRDTGPGIPREDQARIFERFYRGDRARASDGGSGLGLAIVREIVQAHGGGIQVESQVGRGTTMTVLLPVRRAG